jgi:polysaccharide export outer membrane protein
MSVIQAIGAAGGVNDEKATPAGVFIYRLEPAEIAAQLDPERAASGAMTPVVYQLDLQQPESFFLAQTMAIQPNDVLYIAEARSSALFKFLRIIGATTSLVATPVALARP